MVIYAKGGSKGTAVEAASRTGRQWRAQGSSWLSLKSGSFLYVQLLYEYITFFVWIQLQLCITMLLIKGSDKSLVNNRKYKMNAQGL